MRDLHLGRIRQQHPQRNLQTPPRWIADRDRAVSLLRSADNPKGGTMERVELIEDLDVRGFCAQGTVGAGGCIRIYTAWFPPADSLPTTRAGFIRNTLSFFRSMSSSSSFEPSSQTD